MPPPPRSPSGVGRISIVHASKGNPQQTISLERLHARDRRERLDHGNRNRQGPEGHRVRSEVPISGVFRNRRERQRRPIHLGASSMATISVTC
jgi:hypothetical protein